MWKRVFILGGGIENILSFGGSKRNKFFGVASLGSFLSQRLGVIAVKNEMRCDVCNGFSGSQELAASWSQLQLFSKFSFVFQSDTKTHRILLMEKCKFGFGKMIIRSKHLYFCQRQIGFYQQLFIINSLVPIVKVNKLMDAQDTSRVRIYLGLSSSEILSCCLITP